MGLSARLVADAKMTQDSAERWIGVWEGEARSRHLDARTSAWWDGAWEWIAQQRRPPLADGDEHREHDDPDDPGEEQSAPDDDGPE